MTDSNTDTELRPFICLNCEHTGHEEVTELGIPADPSEWSCPDCDSLRWVHESVAFLLSGGQPFPALSAPQHDRFIAHRRELDERQRAWLQRRLTTQALPRTVIGP